jgi:acyl-CoA thioesterase
VTKFDRDTAVEPLGAGRHGARIDRGWWIVKGPNGGYVAAILVRAMEAELGTATADRQLRSITVHYLAAPPEGPVEVAVTVERAGRGLSTVSARMTAGDRLLAIALAAFAIPYTGADAYEHARMPEADPPGELFVPPDMEGIVPVARNFRMRPSLGPMPLTGAEEAHTGGWLELAEERPIDAALLVALADAWFPAPFPRLARPAAAPTIDLTVHVRARLPLPAQPLLGDFSSSVLRDGFFEEDGALFAADGTLVAQSRQLALLL